MQLEFGIIIVDNIFEPVGGYDMEFRFRLESMIRLDMLPSSPKG